jgi:hypothetical protein
VYDELSYREKKQFVGEEQHFPDWQLINLFEGTDIDRLAQGVLPPEDRP